MPRAKTVQQHINDTRNKRDRDIIAMRNRGELIQDIADKMGLTRQRVSQIIAANTKPVEA